MSKEAIGWVNLKMLKFLQRSLEKQAQQERRFRESLLMNLANIEPTSLRLTKLLCQFKPIPSDVANVQTELQSLWRDPWEMGTTPFSTRVLEEWLVQATQSPKPTLVPNRRTGQIEFLPDNFLGQLVIAVLENWRKFRVCLNPECPARFFFAKRSTSVVCERGDCSKYAQQQHALKWWRENRQKKESHTK